MSNLLPLAATLLVALLGPVSGAAAQRQVVLTRLPQPGSKHVLLCETFSAITDMNQKLVMKYQLSEEATALSAGILTMQGTISAFAVTRNDMHADEARMKKIMMKGPLTERVDKFGNFVSGDTHGVEPTSRHFPNHPVKEGDRWQGSKGSGPSKQAIAFLLEKVLDVKGHTVAKITYSYYNSHKAVVTVHEWIDTGTGWTVRMDDSSRRKSGAHTIEVGSRMFDSAYFSG